MITLHILCKFFFTFSHSECRVFSHFESSIQKRFYYFSDITLHLLYNKFFAFHSHHVAFSTQVSGYSQVITLHFLFKKSLNFSSHYVASSTFEFLESHCTLQTGIFFLFHTSHIRYSIQQISYTFPIITLPLAPILLPLPIHHSSSSTQISYSFPVSCCIHYKTNSLLILIQTLASSAQQISFSFSVK